MKRLIAVEQHQGGLVAFERKSPEISDIALTVRGRGLTGRRFRPRTPVRPGAPVLVFLHEGLGCMDLWGDFPELLADACGLEAMLYDRWGHGRSTALESGAVDPDYHECEADEFLPQVLALCNIRRSVLIGHSDGGTIALMYASRHPRGVAGIVTEAAHVFVDEVTRAGVERTVGAFRAGPLQDKLHKYHGNNLEFMFWRWADTWRSPAFAAWDIRSQLARIACPVLVLQGDGDEYGTPAQMQAIAAGVGGSGEAWLVPRCGHIPHHQARRAVLERMHLFVRQLA